MIQLNDRNATIERLGARVRELENKIGLEQRTITNSTKQSARTMTDDEQREKLKAAIVEQLAPLERAVSDAKARVYRAEAELKSAKADLLHAENERFSVAADFDLKISQAENVLRASANREVLYRFRSDLESQRHTLIPQNEFGEGPTNRHIVTASSGPSVRAAVARGAAGLEASRAAAFEGNRWRREAVGVLAQVDLLKRRPSAREPAPEPHPGADRQRPACAGAARDAVNSGRTEKAAGGQASGLGRVAEGIGQGVVDCESDATHGHPVRWEEIELMRLRNGNRPNRDHLGERAPGAGGEQESRQGERGTHAPPRFDEEV